MPDVICLYDENGLSADAWLKRGYDVWCYDLATQFDRVEERHGHRVHFVPWDALDESQNDLIVMRHGHSAHIILAFPPCTDLAVSGAAWFEKKRAANPDFQKDAMKLFFVAESIANRLDVPYALENPVSVASTLWRKPDYTFHPYEYGGYLPEDDQHPLFPEYIAPRDAYPKKTCYWTGNGFVMPDKSPVYCPPGYSAQHTRLGGKSEKVKRIRSASPRGVAEAIASFNS